MGWYFKCTYCGARDGCDCNQKEQRRIMNLMSCSAIVSTFNVEYPELTLLYFHLVTKTRDIYIRYSPGGDEDPAGYMEIGRKVFMEALEEM